MNFLAHIYLSFDYEQIRIGNFIADGVRGNKYKHLPENIQKGIVLHRAIDSYTDTHPIVKQSILKLRPHHGLYSGVIVAIFYDHFLAKNWADYHEQPLSEYVSGFYELVAAYNQFLPPKVKHMMPYMTSGNWLLSYAKIDGIARVLKGMDGRTKGKSKMALAIVDLEAHYPEFENEFTLFFEEVQDFARQRLHSLFADNLD
jgi:acyl carrier protein phosphodiesterase